MIQALANRIFGVVKDKYHSLLICGRPESNDKTGSPSLQAS
jgi:hypothetical protein